MAVEAIGNLAQDARREAERMNSDFCDGIEELSQNADASSLDFIDFRGFRFPKIEFLGQPFPKKAMFCYAEFADDVDFSRQSRAAYTLVDGNIRESLLINGASFRHTQFHGDARFTACHIAEMSYFTKAHFLGNADFAGVQFDEYCDFNDATFDKQLMLPHAKFDSANFHASKFRGDIDCTLLTVKRGISFAFSEFHQPFLADGMKIGSLYEDVTDTKAAGVDASRRLPGANFSSVVFHDRFALYGCTFFTDANFSGATFHSRAIFDGRPVEGLSTQLFQSRLYFRSVRTLKEAEIIFEKTDLSRASFHDTNLEDVVFRDVQWNSGKHIYQMGGRNTAYILWDEINDHAETRDSTKTADNYRQLVLNCEAKRDFLAAENFHFREMELLRKGIGKGLGRYLNAYGIYWLTSRYGTSFVQALLVLIAMFVVASLLFMYTGLEPSTATNVDPGHAIEYDLFSDRLRVPPLGDQLYDFGQSFRYTFEVATFQKDRKYQPADGYGLFVLYPALILFPAQSALLLLAIRRRFKR